MKTPEYYTLEGVSALEQWFRKVICRKHDWEFIHDRHPDRLTVACLYCGKIQE